MSGKYILGGVAAAGCAYYVYEKKLQNEINQPKSWPATKYSQLKGDTAGAKLDKGLTNLQKDVDNNTEQLKDWASAKSEDLKDWGDAKSKAASSWAADKQQDAEKYWKETGKPQLKQSLNDAADYLDKKADSAQNIGYSPIFEDPNKSPVLKAGDKYIDTVNQAAFVVHDKAYALKDLVFGSSKSDAQKKAELAKDDASLWLGSKKNEAEKKTKGWFNFKEDPDEAINEVSRGFGENTSFWAKEEADEAKLSKKLQDAKDGLIGAAVSTKDSVVESAKGAKDSVVGTARSATDSAKQTLSSSKETLESKSQEASEAVSDATSKPWFGLKSVDQHDEARLDKLIREMSKGYGENATFFASESYDDISEKPAMIQELRDKLLRNLDEAKKNLDAHRKHWWSWASKKDKELEKAAQDQWENAQSFSNDVEKKFVEGNLKFKDWTDSAIASTRQGLNYANDKTQSGLAQTQKWIRGEK